MKRFNKITPQKYKELEALAATLNPIQKLNNGKPMYRSTNVYKGATNVNTDKKGRTSYTKNSTAGREPVLVNHLLNLIEAYKKYGDKGVDFYKQLIARTMDKKQLEDLPTEEKLAFDATQGGGKDLEEQEKELP